ncbi:MAG: glycosyltransferase [Deltaproteobacteria bacterium]|nr:glycosyltransferase [Deltaproteobacteria bacterium]
MIWIVLPAYNEEANIGRLLGEICATWQETLPHRTLHVLVVDDGSADATADVVRAFRDELDGDALPACTVELLAHEVNQGLAEAIRTGLTTAADRAGDRDVILTMDADNSHVPGLIPTMVRAIGEGYDLVIASRYQPGARVVGLSLQRRVLSYAASWLFRGLFPIPGVRDYTCGFRAYRAAMIKPVLAENPQFISERGFSCMVDILLKLRTQDPPVTMAEVPLLLRYDKKEGASKMDVGGTITDTLALIARRRMGRDD